MKSGLHNFRRRCFDPAEGALARVFLLARGIIVVVIAAATTETAPACTSAFLGVGLFHDESYETAIYARYDELFPLIAKNESNIDLGKITVSYSTDQVGETTVTDPLTGAITLPDRFKSTLFLPLAHIHEAQHAIDIMSAFVGDIPEQAHSVRIPYAAEPVLAKKLLVLEARAYDDMYFLLVNSYPRWLIQKLAHEDVGREFVYLQKVLEIYLATDSRHSFVRACLNLHTKNRVPISFLRDVLDQLNIR